MNNFSWIMLLLTLSILNGYIGIKYNKKFSLFVCGFITFAILIRLFK